MKQRVKVLPVTEISSPMVTVAAAGRTQPLTAEPGLVELRELLLDVMVELRAVLETPATPLRALDSWDDIIDDDDDDDATLPAPAAAPDPGSSDSCACTVHT